MKRWMLFAFPNYYPGGGWEDFKGSFDSIDEAKAMIPADHPYWGDWAFVHVVDSLTGDVVKLVDEGESS